MFDLPDFLNHAPSSSSSSSAEQPQLRPARALLTPVWIGALALLVANDHWFKGAGLLPDLMTGKLSDFAGMLVAPVLLATLLRVRSRRALLACHVAVAVVFAGIQLSAGFAGQWSALMGVFGHAWKITCDPTDLIALPFLLLSWKLLVPQMDTALPALLPLQRTAVAGLSVFGLWSTVATSEFEGGVDPNDEWYEDVFGSLYLNNANEFDVALHVRPLRADVLLDCDHVSTDPGRLLSEDAFGEATHWLLPPRTNIGIEFNFTANDCSAVWISGEGIQPRILFVDGASEHAPRWWSGQTFDDDFLGAEAGGIAVEFDADGGANWIGGESILFTPRSDAPEQPDSCEAPANEARIDWPFEIPDNAHVLAVEAGADGCFEFELQELYWTGGEPVNQGQPYTWYLCAPAAGVPFAAEDVLSFQESYGAGGERELRVTLLDPTTLEPQRNESGLTTRSVRYLRGGSDPAFIGPAIDRTLVAVPGVGCPWQLQDSCATVERHVDLAVTGGASYLQPGVAVGFASGDWVHTAILGYSKQRAVIDQSCAEGALALSYDIDIVVIDEPLI